MPWCRKCKVAKPITDFDISYATRYFQTCRACRDAYSRKRPCVAGATEKLCGGCNRILPIESFSWNAHVNGKSYRGSRCRECRAKAASEWKNKPGNAKRARLRRYGISLDEYNTLLAFQNGKCAICGSTKSAARFGKTNDLDVDHCHKTGKVRGLLCSTCNNGLGCFKDDPELLHKAIAYLAKSQDG